MYVVRTFKWNYDWFDGCACESNVRYTSFVKWSIIAAVHSWCMKLFQSFGSYRLEQQCAIPPQNPKMFTRLDAVVIIQFSHSTWFTGRDGIINFQHATTWDGNGIGTQTTNCIRNSLIRCVHWFFNYYLLSTFVSANKYGFTCRSEWDACVYTGWSNCSQRVRTAGKNAN